MKLTNKLKILELLILMGTITSAWGEETEEYIKKRVLEISRNIVENSAQTLPENPKIFKEKALEFYSRVDNADTPRKIILGDELVSYQVPLRSGNEFLDMIYISPDGEHVTEWPGYREEKLKIEIYNPETWSDYASVPLKVIEEVFRPPHLIDADSPSFLPRAGKTAPQEVQEQQLSMEDILPFLVLTDIDKIGNYPVNRQWGYPVNPEWADFTIENYDKIPYKNLQERGEWISRVNDAYNLQWDHLPGRRAVSGKCLSYAASYIADWFKIKNSDPPYDFNPYVNYLRGERELGMNPRVLEILSDKLGQKSPEEKPRESVKHDTEQEKASQERRIAPSQRAVRPDDIPGCPMASVGAELVQTRVQNYVDTRETRQQRSQRQQIENPFLRDSVTGEQMDMALENYAEVLSSEWPSRQIEDPVIRDFIYDIHRNPSGIKDYKVLFQTNRDADEEIVKEALKKDGIILAGIIYRSLGLPVATSVHSAAIIGYQGVGGKTYFIYKEVFGEYDWDEPETEKGGPSYRMMPIEEFYEAYAFID